MIWRKQHTPFLLPNYVILTLLAVFSLAPLTIMVLNAFKTKFDIAVNPLGLPTLWHWENFQKAWNAGNYSVAVQNSAIITLSTVAGVLVIAGLAAYSLARLKPVGGDILTVYLLVGTSMPIQLFLVPLYYLWAKLGLIDHLLGVIIIYWAIYSPFATFLLRSFMVSIPQDILDSARVDGASEWLVFWRMVTPLVWPGFLTVGLITGLWAWNEFMIAVTFLQSASVQPVSISIYSFVNSTYGRDWALTSAASLMMILPIIVLFLLLQRRFIAGLTQGALKA